MKWRALAVVVLGVSAALASCSLEPEWQNYCGHPGRCSKFDAGPGAIHIAQGSVDRRIVLTGEYLAEAETVSVVPDTAGTATIDTSSSNRDQVTVKVSVKPGVSVGDRFTLRVRWQRADEFQDSIPLEVTAITVQSPGDGGNDTAGFGTPENPYATLLKASQVSNAGDTIRLGPGQFASIYDRTMVCDPASGLKPGVSVQGESLGASEVIGSGDPDTCAFNLTGGNQTVSGITITGFTEGIRVTNSSGARPTVSNVRITSCDAGVVGRAGSFFQLQGTELVGNGAGLVCDGCDAVMQVGKIEGSARNGVLMSGDGGRLTATGGFIQDNAKAFTGPGDDLTGAGVLIAANGGTATIGSTISQNGRTGVTVAGRSNVVTFDGATLQGSAGAYALLVAANSDAGVFLKNTTVTLSSVGVKVMGAAFVNGGTSDGGYGGNTFSCYLRNESDPASSLELWDARPLSSQPPLVFSRSSFHGNGAPPAGTDVTTGSPDAGWGIQVDNGNHVRFE